MTKYIFMFLFLTSAYAPFSEAEESEPIVTCTTNLPMLGLGEANRYAEAVIAMIEWSLDYTDDGKTRLKSQAEIQQDLADFMPKDITIIWEDAILLRNEYFSRMTAEGLAEKSVIFGYRVQQSITSTVLKNSQYFLIFDIGREDQDGNVQPAYTLKFGLDYTFDTCSGEGYIQGPTGVIVVKRKNGTAHSLLNPFKK